MSQENFKESDDINSDWNILINKNDVAFVYLDFHEFCVWVIDPHRMKSKDEISQALVHIWTKPLDLIRLTNSNTWFDIIMKDELWHDD